MGLLLGIPLGPKQAFVRETTLIRLPHRGLLTVDYCENFKAECCPPSILGICGEISCVLLEKIIQTCLDS